MSKSADLIKSIAKKPVGEKPTYGTDPRDPWSAKAGITEDAILNKFLKSRGINPQYVSKDQKVAHSKMGEFKKWKQDHMFEQTTEPSPTMKRLKELKKSQKHQTPIVKGVAEDVDKKDTVTFDIPLLIRVLELAREDIKSDMDLHRVVERLINMRDQGMLTMDDYDEIAQIKEDYAHILEDSMYGARADKLLARSHSAFRSGDKETSSRAHKLFLKARDKHWSNPVNKEKSINAQMSGATADYADREKKYGPGKVRDSVELNGEVISELKKSTLASYAKKATDDSSYHSFLAGTRSAKDPERLKDDQKAMKRQAGVNKAIDRLAKEEVVTEVSDATLSSYKEKAKKSADTLHAQGQYKKSTNRWLNVMKATGKQIDKLQKENTLDPKAATEAPCDCANSSDDVAPKDKNKKLIQMSKSARIIKSIYNRKNMKEETFDSEKEDKSVTTYGKKPKLTDSAKKIEATGGKTQAAAIMTGGTTLTGTPRDTVEIDPMMKLKPGLIGQTKK